MGSSCSMFPDSDDLVSAVFVNDEGVHSTRQKDGDVEIDCNRVYEWENRSGETKKKLYLLKEKNYGCSMVLEKEWCYTHCVMEYFEYCDDSRGIHTIELKNRLIEIGSKYQRIRRINEKWQKIRIVYKDGEIESKTFYNRFGKTIFEIKYLYANSYLTEEYYYPKFTRKEVSYKEPLVCYSDDETDYFYNKKIETIVDNIISIHFYNNDSVVRLVKYKEYEIIQDVFYEHGEKKFEMNVNDNFKEKYYYNNKTSSLVQYIKYNKNDEVLQEIFFGQPKFAFDFKPKGSTERVRYDYTKLQIDYVDRIKTREIYFNRNDDIIREISFLADGKKKESFYYNKLIQCYSEKIDKFTTYQYFQTKTLNYIDSKLVCEEFMDFENKLIKRINYSDGIISSIEYKKELLNRKRPLPPINLSYSTKTILEVPSAPPLKVHNSLPPSNSKLETPSAPPIKVLITDNNECSICCVSSNVPQPKCKFCKFSYMCKECEDRCIKSGKCPFCNGLYS